MVPGMHQSCGSSSKVEWQRTSGVVPTLELSSGVFDSEGSRFIPAWGEEVTGHWRPGAFHQ